MHAAAAGGSAEVDMVRWHVERCCDVVLVDTAMLRQMLSAAAAHAAAGRNAARAAANAALTLMASQPLHAAFQAEAGPLQGMVTALQVRAILSGVQSPAALCWFALWGLRVVLSAATTPLRVRGGMFAAGLSR